MPDDVGAKHGRRRRGQGGHGRHPRRQFLQRHRHRWKLYFTKRTFPSPAPSTAPRWTAFVAGIAKELDIAPVNAALAIENGKIKVIESVQRQSGRPGALAEQLSALLVTLHSTTVEVPVVVKEPDVKAEDNAAAQQQAETMISGDGHGHRRRQEVEHHAQIRSPPTWASAPRMKNGVSTLVPFMDVTKLQPTLDAIAPDVVTGAGGRLLCE